MDRKVVQTELPITMHEEFRYLARRKKRKIEEVARENKLESDDPFFKLRSVAFKDKKTSENVDKILYC